MKKSHLQWSSLEAFRVKSLGIATAKSNGLLKNLFQVNSLRLYLMSLNNCTFTVSELLSLVKITKQPSGAQPNGKSVLKITKQMKCMKKIITLSCTSLENLFNRDGYHWQKKDFNWWNWWPRKRSYSHSIKSVKDLLKLMRINTPSWSCKNSNN